MIREDILNERMVIALESIAKSLSERHFMFKFEQYGYETNCLVPQAEVERAKRLWGFDVDKEIKTHRREQNGSID